MSSLRPILSKSAGPDLLRRVKLGRCLDTLPERLTLAHSQNLSHHEFLELLLADEVTRRDTQSAQLRARTANLEPTMTLDRWDDTTNVTYDRTEASSAPCGSSTHPTTPSSSDPSASAKPSSPLPLDMLSCAANAACTSNEPTSCSNVSKPWTQTVQVTSIVNAKGDCL